MCNNCENATQYTCGYYVYYTCKLDNNETSEIIDTYFNKSTMMIECKKEKTRNM
jgi:hypothetical protein